MRRIPLASTEDEVRIVVTAAGSENLLFRTLLREAAEMLLFLEDEVPEMDRLILAGKIQSALETPETDQEDEYLAEEGHSPWE